MFADLKSFILGCAVQLQDFTKLKGYFNISASIIIQWYVEFRSQKNLAKSSKSQICFLRLLSHCVVAAQILVNSLDGNVSERDKNLPSWAQHLPWSFAATLSSVNVHRRHQGMSYRVTSSSTCGFVFLVVPFTEGYLYIALCVCVHVCYFLLFSLAEQKLFSKHTLRGRQNNVPPTYPRDVQCQSPVPVNILLYVAKGALKT